MVRAKALKPKQSQGTAVPDGYAVKEAQARFERAVDVAVATKPLHQTAKPTSKKSKR